MNTSLQIPKRVGLLGVLASLTAASVLLVGCAAYASPPASATPSAAVVSRLTDVGQKTLDAGATAFVGTVRDETHISSVALGTANRGSHRDAKVSDEFEMGSTTKTVTATVALQLVGEGILTLKDPIDRWLPGLVPGGDRITLRMLLQHTSGIFDYTSDDDFAHGLLDHPERTYTPKQLVAVAVKHAPNFAPGAGWAYSNTGFVLVGMILTAATGQSVASLIEHRVIRPLGLSHTYWAGKSVFTGAHLRGYYRTKPGGTDYVDVSKDSISWAGAAGSLVSTTADLGSFERALQSGKLLKPAQLAEMRSTVEIPGTGGQYAYGLGLMRITTPNGYVWGHTGGTLGYLTQAWASEDGTRSIVENVPTGASTPVGPDSDIESAASAAASSLFDLLNK